MKILVALDDNHCSRKAFDFVLKIVQLQDEVILLSVAEDVSRYVVDYVSANPGQLVAMNESIKNSLKKVLKEHGAILTARNIKHRCLLGSGKVSDVILTEAKELQVDLIIIGRRQLSTVNRAFLESHSSLVVHNAPCAVLVVKSIEEGTHTSSKPAEVV